MTAVKPDISRCSVHDVMEPTSMTCISIGNHGPQVIDGGWELFALCRGLRPGPALFSVVEELSLEKLGNLVGNGVGGVIYNQH